MATGMLGQTIWSANANSTNVGLFLFAKMVAGNLFDRAGAGDVTVGVFVEVNGTSGPASAVLDGVCKITIGAGSLNAGAKVESDANGKAVANSSGFLAGILLTGGAPGDIVSMKIAS
jgi:hypothetical protein